ncbi:MAG: hypothetical protein ACR2MK_06950 [Solirubrobacteraceae bacterium]
MPLVDARAKGTGAAARCGTVEGVLSQGHAGADGNPAVLAALALGWELADLYAAPEPGPADPPSPATPPVGAGTLAAGASTPPASAATLPAVADLRPRERREVGVARVTALIGRAFAEGGGARPSPAIDLEPGDASRPAVYALHLRLLTQLEARDAALSGAYELGRSLADVSRAPSDLSSLMDRLEAQRLVPIECRLADLSSKLPPHAGAAVAATLDQWRHWTEDARAREDMDGVNGALSRQRALWRALLNGDKDAREMLDPDTLVAASVRHASRLGTMIRGLAGAYLPALAALAVAVFLVLYVIVDRTAIATVIAALGALAATMIGIRKGLSLTVQDTIDELRGRLWGAELDAAVAQSILRLPPASVAAPRPKPSVPKPPSAAGASERTGIAQRIERALHVTTSARKQGFRVPASGPTTTAPQPEDEGVSANGKHDS